ncbi:LIM and calponin homology domains-containing protein 1-like isoform X2 [Uloborus diversus]|uniref:LIM and calponin homology domains-containing protein 1-like isoform X2 n=1 Tax=Uloborus diversus TaxID=327109 RepID=UPI002409C25F|nr:LIM and calponin homology domains-containing protein 1-like isoform X2 [Uloborus diversus]
MPGTTRYSATFDRTYEEDDRVPPEPAMNGRRSRSLSLQANGALYTPLPGGRTPQQRSSSTDNGPGKVPEHIPTRTVAKTTVKSHTNPFQFVKVGTCPLYRKAEEQLKKAKEVKKPEVLKEEEEEWQTNLDSWKSRRRKMSEDVFRRQEEIKQFEMEEQVQQCNQRKTKTFSEMLESRAHRGRALSLCLLNSPLDSQIWEVEGRGSKSCANSSYSGGSEENSTVNSEDEGVSFKGLNEKNGQGISQNKSRTNGISMAHSPSSSCDGLSELETNGGSRREGHFVDSGLESLVGSHGAADTPDSCSDSSHDGRSSLDCDSPTTNGSYENGHAKVANGNSASQSPSGTDLKIKLNLSSTEDVLGFTFQGKQDGQVVVTSMLEASNENSHMHQNGMTNGYASTNEIQNGHIEVVKNGNTDVISPLRGPDSPMNSPKLVQEVSKNGERSIESENEMYVDDFEECGKSPISVCSTQALSSTTSVSNQENSLQSPSKKTLIPLSLKPNDCETSSALAVKDKILDKNRDKSPIPEVTIKRFIKKKNKESSKNDSMSSLDPNSAEIVRKPLLVQNFGEEKVKLKVKLKPKAKCDGHSPSSEIESSTSNPEAQNVRSRNDEKLSDKEEIEKNSSPLLNNIPHGSSNKAVNDCSSSEIKGEVHPRSTDCHPRRTELSLCNDNKMSIKISDPLLNKIMSSELSQSATKSPTNELTDSKKEDPVHIKSSKHVVPKQRKTGAKLVTPTVFSKNQENQKESDTADSKRSPITSIGSEYVPCVIFNSSEKGPDLNSNSSSPCSDEVKEMPVDVQGVSVCKQKAKNKSSKKKTSSQKQTTHIEESISIGKESINIIFESHPTNNSNQELPSRGNEDSIGSGERNPLLSKQEVVPVEKVAEEMEKLILEQLEEEERAKELAAEIQQIKSVEHLLTAPPRLAEPPKEKPPPPPISSNEIQKPNSLKRVNSTKRIKKEIHKRRSNFLGIENTDENIVCDESSVPPPLALEEILKAEMELDRESRKKLENATVERLTLEEKEIMQKEREIIETLESEERRRLLYGIHSELPSMLPNDSRQTNCEEDRILDLQEERKRLEEDHLFTKEKQLILERAEYIKRQEEAIRKERERLRQEQEALQREKEEHRRKLAEQEELLRNQKSHGDADCLLMNGPMRPVSSRIKSPQNDAWGQQKVPSVRKQNPDALTEIRYNQNHWLIQEAEMRRIAEQRERLRAAALQSDPRTHLAEDDVCSARGVQKYPPAVSSDKPLVFSRRNVLPPTPPAKPSRQQEHVLSVSGRKRCSHCGEELGRGAAMIIESLQLYYHIQCFQCCVCQAQLGNGSCGTDVRVRNNKLHCHNCYSNDEAGLKFSQV